MKYVSLSSALFTLAGVFASTGVVAGNGNAQQAPPEHRQQVNPPGLAKNNVQVGPRPYFLVRDMDEGALKDELMACAEGPFRRTEFTVSHRGAPLQFPEHTKESYEAAYRMGAGIQECDVTFTRDQELVCRHSQCDLHTTTDVLAIPELAAKCSQPFVPADPVAGTPASARCCTSDFTLAEFRRLQGKMDAADSRATTVEQYMKGTADWRTDLYASRGTLLTHAESIELFKRQGVKMTPELKSPSVPMPFNGFTQQDYAQKMIDEYKLAGVPAGNVFPQSFDYHDILYWIGNEPAFGTQATFLDGRYDVPAFNHADPSTWNPSMQQLVDDGVKILAPPLWMLVRVNDAGVIEPSVYARAAKAVGLDFITWSFERDGPLANGGGFYFQSTNGANQDDPHAGVINNDGDMMEVLDVLGREVGVLGVFTDWPGTVTYYTNCVGLK